jgi:hypothetical protein
MGRALTVVGARGIQDRGDVNVILYVYGTATRTWSLPLQGET